MKRNLVQLFFIALQRSLKMTMYNIFGRISLTLFLLEIFNFIPYANYTTYDITVHNTFSKIIRNSQRDLYIPH